MYILYCSPSAVNSVYKYVACNVFCNKRSEYWLDYHLFAGFKVATSHVVSDESPITCYNLKAELLFLFGYRNIYSCVLYANKHFPRNDDTLKRTYLCSLAANVD